MARPREYDRDALAAEFASYITRTPVPIIAEFAYLFDVPRELLYDWDEFSTLLKRCIGKKEAALERGMLSGTFPPSAAIFSLKQLGWKDTHESTHKTDGPLTFAMISSDIPPQPKTA